MKYILGCIFLIFSIQSYALTLDDLGYKSVFRGLYSGLFDPRMDKGEDLKNKKTIGVEVSKDKDFLAIYNEPEKYINAQGEERFLVNIERRAIGVSRQGIGYEFTETCHACYSSNDLFIFKKDQKTGAYLLVSKTNEGFPSFGDFGVSQLDTKNLEEKLIKLKPDVLGFFTTIYTVHQGFEEEFLSTIVLDENAAISSMNVDETSTSTEGAYSEDTALSYSFDSKWIVLDKEQPILGYYPIQITFKGENQKDNGKFEKYNKVKKYVMNKNFKEYKEISSVDY